MTNFKPVTHIIFDLDGLLLDSEPIYYKVHSDIFRRFCKKHSKELQQKIMGRTAKDMCKIFVEDLQLPITAEEFMELHNKESAPEIVKAKLLPGAERLIRHFSRCGIPMAIATSSNRYEFDLKATNHKELFSLMDHVVTGGSDPEVKKGKPAPDIFLVCASKFPGNPPPENVLVFEDAPNGVFAGVTAGMQVVMVPVDDLPQQKRVHATLEIPSLQEFQPELFGLPPFTE